MDITAPRFTDQDKAREHLEALRWPQGPFCPHCGSFDAKRLEGKRHRAGLVQCNDCRQQYTVTVGTVFERSKIPLNQWLLCNHLLCASKKGMSAKQIERMLGVTYKTAWFMCHRIREAMKDNGNTGPLGGADKVVEADETYVGGKAKNRAFRRPAEKKAVVALVEREGHVRSFHVANVTAKDLRPLIVTCIDRALAPHDR
jgi:transposase-like protein